MPSHQYSLDLIQHQLASSIIEQRGSDGYINATQLCQAAGRRWDQYVREEANGRFLRALSKSEGLEVPKLYPTVTAGDGQVNVWVHPKVAINLGQWLSGEFAVKVADWVYAWMNGGVRPRSAQLPYHLQRHMQNVGKVPHTHFSILQEMTTTLIAPLEVQGYTLPESMVPDISQGRMFCKFARESLGLDTDALPTYQHEFPDGRVVDAKLYPVEHLGSFRQFISTVWMPQRAAGYFKDRDPQALPLLDKVLQVGFSPPRLGKPVARKKRA
ncbi:KilA-N domain protein [Ostertagia ostertagi]